MITSTQSDSVKCPYQLSYTHIGPLNRLCVDIMPFPGVGTNTGNAFPMTDGWVFYDFQPPIDGVFPAHHLDFSSVVVPRMSEYMEFNRRDIADMDFWVATFHEEQAISLGHRSSDCFFEEGDTWKLKRILKLPVQSV